MNEKKDNDAAPPFCTKNSPHKIIKKWRRDVNHKKEDQKENTYNDEELLELLSSVYALGYLKAWERFSPESVIYNKESVENG